MGGASLLSANGTNARRLRKRRRKNAAFRLRAKCENTLFETHAESADRRAQDACRERDAEQHLQGDGAANYLRDITRNDCDFACHP